MEPFVTKIGKSNVDTMTDFTPGEDFTWRDHGIFTKLVVGNLDPGVFDSDSKMIEAQSFEVRMSVL